MDEHISFKNSLTNIQKASLQLREASAERNNLEFDYLISHEAVINAYAELYSIHIDAEDLDNFEILFKQATEKVVRLQAKLDRLSAGYRLTCDVYDLKAEAFNQTNEIFAKKIDFLKK